EMVALQPAMSRMGAAGVSISFRSTPSELSYLVNHSRAHAMFFGHEVCGVVREALPSFETLPRERMFCVGGKGEGFPTYEELLDAPGSRANAGGDDAAVIIYTSGTTGRPKGAVRKFPRDVVEGTLQIIASSPLRTDDVHLAVLPFYHSTAYAFTSFSHLVGATVVILERFDPEGFLSAVQEHGVTQTAMVPTLLHRVLQLGSERIWRYDTGTLRAILLAGAPLSGELAASAMDVFGDVLYNYYGSTETGLNLMAGPEDLRLSPGTIGRILPGHEVRLLGEDGREVPRGEVGELYVRGPMMVEGYHDDEAATRSSQREGFFSVGDLAWVDERGCHHLAGRKGDMIISGGVNVYPAEVERVIEAHPLVAEVSVIGLPDE
ncbi:MAG: AMP-binding protein, partial [Coriobacteriia bacterium]|nr:AMP-binding protein [Coriobacteriia bacterium]